VFHVFISFFPIHTGRSVHLNHIHFNLLITTSHVYRPRVRTTTLLITKLATPARPVRLLTWQSVPQPRHKGQFTILLTLHSSGLSVHYRSHPFCLVTHSPSKQPHFVNPEATERFALSVHHYWHLTADNITNNLVTFPQLPPHNLQHKYTALGYVALKFTWWQQHTTVRFTVLWFHREINFVQFLSTKSATQRSHNSHKVLTAVAVTVLWQCCISAVTVLHKCCDSAA